MSTLRKMGIFLRWRLVPMRYLTMLWNMRLSLLFRRPPLRMLTTQAIHENGYGAGPNLSPEQLAAMQATYCPRMAVAQPKTEGNPFVNLFTADDIDPDNLVFRYAFSPEVLDVAADYFGGKLILDSIQVLYSYPTGGKLRESQYWHLDYGDTRTFHCVAYLNDVLKPEDGPFVFVDKRTSKLIGQSPLVRRIPDAQFDAELKEGQIQSFFAPAGTAVFVDPQACYHYGSRCEKSRLAIFVTFSSWFPFVQPVPLVRENRAKIWHAARKVRPDLTESFLTTLLQLDAPPADLK